MGNVNNKFHEKRAQIEITQCFSNIYCKFVSYSEVSKTPRRTRHN